jgi:branched-chain amino acid transport system substrate-binding protein
MLANGTGKAVVQTGGDTWFFLTADYAFGHALERDTEAVIVKNGGKVLGRVRHPLATQDFSSFLLQAQASKAKIIGLANAGGDTINSIKQAAEFGITKGGQNLAGLLVFITDIHSLGLQTAQGLILTETFYWDLNEQTRAWSKRFAAANGGKYPSMDQAGVYGVIRQDGRKLHNAYLFEVKKPSESKGPWDYYKLRYTIPADQAFRPLNEGDCPLIKK